MTAWSSAILQDVKRTLFSSGTPKKRKGHFMNKTGICLPGLVATLGVLVALVGCSGSGVPLGKVSGKVTLDGQPLAGVIINFKPEEGRAATGTTDGEGNYTLEYSYDEMGAKVGPNTVMFEWPLEAGEVGDSAPRRPIPAKYTGLKSELKVEVQKGKNSFDFDLTSK
jgi:hypothetical protein